MTVRVYLHSFGRFLQICLAKSREIPRKFGLTVTIRYDTIEEINVDSKAEYTA